MILEMPGKKGAQLHEEEQKWNLKQQKKNNHQYFKKLLCPFVLDYYSVKVG